MLNFPKFPKILSPLARMLYNWRRAADSRPGEAGSVMPDKYQDEIEEILKGIEETAPLPQSRGRRQSIPDDQPSLRLEPEAEPARATPSSRRWRTFSPGRVALAGIALLLCGLMLPWFGLSLFSPLIWVGLLALAAAYLLFFIRPRGGANQGQYWRGRPVESDSPSLLARAAKWFKK